MAHMKNEFLEHYQTQTSLPVYPPFGMTPTEFAECQNTFTQFARKRILDSSNQYDHGTSQRMEELTAVEIVNELREEIADAVNYLTGLDIYLARIPWQLADDLQEPVT